MINSQLTRYHLKDVFCKRCPLKRTIKMKALESDRHLHQERLVFSLSIGNDHSEKIERSESIMILIEPVVFITEDVELELDDEQRRDLSTSFALSGILYSLLKRFFFVTGSFIVKQLQIDLLDILIVRFIVQLSMLITDVLYRHYPMWMDSSKEKWFQFVLYILHDFLIWAFFLAFRYLLLPDLTTLNFICFIWTETFSLLIYKEKSSLMILLAVGSTMIGVTFVIQPTCLLE